MSNLCVNGMVMGRGYESDIQRRIRIKAEKEQKRRDEMSKMSKQDESNAI